MRLRTGRFETGAGTFGHEALGGISSPAGSCLWQWLVCSEVFGNGRCGKDRWSPCQAGAGARNLDRGARDAGGLIPAAMARELELVAASLCTMLDTG